MKLTRFGAKDIRVFPRGNRWIQGVRAGLTSVWEKSFPLKSNTSSAALATAYAMQSPKFSRAAWFPLPNFR